MAQEPLRIDFYYWKGQKRYRCPECKFDSYSLDYLQKHIHEHTKAKARAKGKGPILFDPAGKAINNDEGERIVGGDDITEQLGEEIYDHGAGTALGPGPSEKFRFSPPEWQPRRTDD